MFWLFGLFLFTLEVTETVYPKILIEWGGLFHDINLKNNGAIAILRLFHTCG
jgi:hypothetical protein